jgi:hypothetical protein
MFSQYWVANVPGSTITAAQSVVLQGLGDVTATAAEINAGVDGLTATATELNNKFDGSKSYKAYTSTGLGAAETILAADSGKKLLMPDCTASCTLTLPVPAAGLNYRIIYVGAATDAQNWVLQSTSNTNYFSGGLQHHKTSDNSITTAYANGTGEDTLTVATPEAGTILDVLCNGTIWYLWGSVVSDTAPAFSS